MAAGGQADIFSGDVRSKEDILKDIINDIYHGNKKELGARLREAAENRQRDNRGESEVADAGEGDSGSGEGQAVRAEAGGERVEEEQPDVREHRAEGEAEEQSEWRKALGKGLDEVLGETLGKGYHTLTEEGQARLDEENGKVQLQKRLAALDEAETFIEEALQGKRRGQRIEIELPKATETKIRRAMGHDFNSHNIYANGIVHSKKNHGEDGEKLAENSIPLRDEDFKLAPHIMVAPDRVTRGNMGPDGRESIRFEKDLSNGVVLVVEKEQRESPDDMDTITMWANLSSRGADARFEKRPLQSTSKPTDNDLENNAKQSNVVTVITSFDAAKIRKDSETAIKNDEKINFHKVFHGSGADFEKFDGSHMGEGEGAQVYGYGHYTTEVEGIGKHYANSYGMASVMMNGVPIRQVLSNEDYWDRQFANFVTGHERTLDELKESIGHVYIDGRIAGPRSKRVRELKKQKDRLLAAIDNGEVKIERDAQPTLYTVDIPDDNGSNYLDWSRTIAKSDRRRIAEAVRGLEGEPAQSVKYANYRGGWEQLANMIEREPWAYQEVRDRLVQAFGGRTADEKRVSDLMHGAGFVGVKYPAEYLSGGRNDGAKNYVIFDDKDLQITDKVKFFKTNNGEAYGFTVDGEIYIDPRIATPETRVHEYAHLWAQGLKERNPRGWEQLKREMAKEADVIDYVKRLYPELFKDGVTDEGMEEVFAHYSGRRGAERLEREMQEEMAKANGVFEKAQVASVFAKIRDLLSKFWKMSRDLFAGKVRGIEKLKGEDFADMMLGDLLGHFDPGKKNKEWEAKRDREYMEAVERGDMEKAQRMVDDAARKAGYVRDADYRMHHKAPNGRDGFSKSIADPTGLYPEDLYGPNGARYYGDGNMWMDMASAAIFRRVHHDPEAMVKIYRAVPKDSKESKLRNGDWVSINRQYAKEHGERVIDGGYKIIEDEVPAKYVYTDANSLHEQGYDDGRDYAYQNTKNNRKLTDAVTYDDEGNVIPLSKRFDSRKSDVRYAKKEPKADRSGNYIGDGSWHVEHGVEPFEEYPQITSSVSESPTTESVYVTYYNTDNGKRVTVRFSNHENNATKYGDQLDGYASRDEILYRLGLRKREFVPKKRAWIPTRQVSKKDLAAQKYPESDYTIQELYKKVEQGESIADEIGKVSKGSNYLIQGDGSIEEETRINEFGEKVRIGYYVYKKLEGEEKQDKMAEAIAATEAIKIGDPTELSEQDKGIYDIFKDKKEGWRKKVIDWALGKLPSSGTKTSFGVVEYRPAKLRGALSHGYGDLKMLTLPYLDRMFKNGVLYDSHKEDDGFTYYNVAHRLRYKGEDYVARLVAREDRQGNLFYDHEFTDIKKIGAPATGREEANNSVTSPHQLFAKVRQKIDSTKFNLQNADNEEGGESENEAKARGHAIGADEMKEHFGGVVTEFGKDEKKYLGGIDDWRRQDGVEKWIPFRDVYPQPTLSDYYRDTRGTFKYVGPEREGKTRREWEAENANQWREMRESGKYEYHKSPMSSSEYLIDKESGDIYRYSDHWGNVGSCRWDIDVPYQMVQNNRLIRSSYVIGKINIGELRGIENGSHYVSNNDYYIPAYKVAIENIKTFLTEVKMTDEVRKRVEDWLKQYENGLKHMEKGGNEIQERKYMFREGEDSYEHSEEERNGMVERAEALGAKLGTAIRVVDDVESLQHSDPEVLEKMKRAKGWYDRVSGRVTIVPGNIEDVEDAVAKN